MQAKKQVLFWKENSVTNICGMAGEAERLLKTD